MTRPVSSMSTGLPGPPPDSFLSVTYFQHGQAGTGEAAAARCRLACDDRVRRVLAHPPGWARCAQPHRHGRHGVHRDPGRPPPACPHDHRGRNRGPVGPVDDRAGGLTRRYSRGWCPATARQPAQAVSVTQTLPAGPFFRGGFSGPAPAAPPRPRLPAGPGRWWPWSRPQNRRRAPGRGSGWPCPVAGSARPCSVWAPCGPCTTGVC